MVIDWTHQCSKAFVAADGSPDGGDVQAPFGAEPGIAFSIVFPVVTIFMAASSHFFSFSQRIVLSCCGLKLAKPY
jgi:hypothetical protein